ncbi:MAG TPA: hypothetical protein DCR14_06140 [Acidimicrobiaceae bacterium]|nr:hypothetical protein [Acidimicrobiaceae bacterium]
MTLRVALVGGPMYDHLYRLLDDMDVEVVVHADHPTLNRAVADMLGRGERLDLISTHSKYAPSQQQWLMALDDVVDASAVAALAPLAVDLCRFDGSTLCLPRLIDVRIMWYRRDRIEVPPNSWNDVVDQGVSFGFPGRESGLFGTFFELVVGAGGQLFDSDGRPRIASPEAVAAVEQLVAMAAHCPPDLPEWHYDQVDAALLDGRVDAAGIWPGGWGPIRDSPVSGLLAPALYPTGPSRRVSYSGCHAWAIPRTCADVPGAVELLHRLVSHDANTIDAAGGSVCAHVDAFAQVAPQGDIDAMRLQLTADTIRTSMITYPPHPRFPEVEDIGWQELNAVLRGARTAAEAVDRIHEAAAARLVTLP